MSPSPTGTMASFPKRLKEIDRDLNCQWNPNTHRFTIHQRTDNPILPNPIIFVVETEEGGFRHPDLRDIDFLQKADIRKEGPKARLKRVAEYMINEREKDRKRAKNMIREQTIDNKNQLVNAFSKAAGFKGNSAFRRVKEKAKGKVY